MSGSNDALTQMLLLQARQQRQPSMQARLAQQMMAANMQAAQTPVWGTGATLARAGSGMLAGLMGGMAERADQQREDELERRFVARADAIDARNRAEAEAFRTGQPMPSAMPQQAPQMPPQGGGGNMPPVTPDAGADAGVAASTARYNAVPGRPPVGSSFREPEWAAGLPPANGRINPLPLEGGSPQPAAAPQRDALTLYQQAVSSPNPLIQRMAPAFLAQAQREDQRANRPPQIVSPGATVFDPNTNRPIFTAPRAPEAPDETARLLAAAGLVPGTPEYQAAARAIVERRGQPPQTNINTGDSPQSILARSDVDTIKNQNAVANQARVLIPLFDRAEEAIRNVPQGAGAQFAPILGQLASAFGVQVNGTSEAEVLRAITASLAPLQRVEGSGATSDRDISLYLQAVPRLGNTREGNLMLVDMGRRAAQRRIEEANIWRNFAGTPNIMDRLNALPPLWTDEERAALRPPPQQSAPAAPGVAGPGGLTMDPPATAPRAPQAGTVMQGFRFRGGNPADRNNWEPVR